MQSLGRAWRNIPPNYRWLIWGLLTGLEGYLIQLIPRGDGTGPTCYGLPVEYQTWGCTDNLGCTAIVNPSDFHKDFFACWMALAVASLAVFAATRRFPLRDQVLKLARWVRWGEEEADEFRDPRPEGPE